MDTYMGLITLFGFNWAPVDWRLANGDVLPISQYSALFSLIGTTYGGDGTQTFGLPDLRSRLPMGQGQGLGLSLKIIGEIAGVESTTMLTAQLPTHAHGVTLSATTASANANAPTDGAMLGNANQANGDQVNVYAPAGGAVLNLNPVISSPTGGSQPISVLNPFLALNFSIAIQGLYPSRP